MEHIIETPKWTNGEYIWRCSCGAQSGVFKGRLTWPKKSTARLRAVEHQRRGTNTAAKLRAGERVVSMNIARDGTVVIKTDTNREIRKLPSFYRYDGGYRL